MTFGALLGGVLTSAFGWRSVFLINIPVAVAVIAVVLVAVAGTRAASGSTSAELSVGALAGGTGTVDPGGISGADALVDLSEARARPSRTRSRFFAWRTARP